MEAERTPTVAPRHRKVDFGLACQTKDESDDGDTAKWP